MQLAQRVMRVKPSPTLAMNARVKAMRTEGKKVISLSVGEPDFDTPDHIKNAAITAIKEGQTKYTAVDGTAELKQAILKKFNQENNLTYDANQVLVSAGAKQSIYNLLQAVINDGDEIVIPAPYWVSYPDMTLLAGGKPIIVETDITQQFKISAEALEKAITKNTRLLILNSPSNPTGSVYTLEELKQLGKVLEQHPRVLIASDDIYEHLRFDDSDFCNIVNACPKLYNRTIVINGVSKAYSMTGWRIGYAAGDADIISAMKKIQSQSSSNPCSISQAAATEALQGDQSDIAKMLSAYKKRHEYAYNTLNAMQGLECIPSRGTFYIFPNIIKAAKHVDCKDDFEFAERLLAEAGVACVPGSAFGAPGYLRISFAVDMKVLEEALSRFKNFLRA